MSQLVLALKREKRNRPHPQSHAPIVPQTCHGHHDHKHHHAQIHRPQQQRALWICLALTLAMMVIEFIAGWVSGSLMLASDAVHMLSHVAALGISLMAIKLANRQCGDHLPYGLYRLEVLAALLNGLGLAAFSMWIVYEGIERLLNPVHISGHELLMVATMGLIVNVVTAVILFRAGMEDLNTKGAWLHMLADGVSSVVTEDTEQTGIFPCLSLIPGNSRFGQKRDRRIRRKGGNRGNNRRSSVSSVSSASSAVGFLPKARIAG